MATGPQAGSRRTDRPVPLRRNYDFLLLWSSQALSTVGSRISYLAFPVVTLALTQSPTSAGLVGFTQTLPFLLLYLPAGTLVDRWDLKRVMLLAELARAAAIGSLGVALLLHEVHLTHIAVAAFLEGAFLVFFELAESAALPEVVPAPQLPDALALSQARQNGAAMLGQPIGGALVSVSLAAPFLVDASTYALSFLALLLLRTNLVASRAGRAAAPGRLLAETRAGLSWLLRQDYLRASLPIMSMVNLSFGAVPLVTIVLAQQLGASPVIIGVIFACSGIGAIIGSAAARFVQNRISLRVITLASLALWAGQLAMFAVSGTPAALCFVAALGPFLGVIFNTALGTHRYVVTPVELRARSLSAARLVAYGALPIGALVGGVLTEQVGARPAFAIFALTMAVTCAAAFAAPSIRRQTQLATASPPTPGHNDRVAP